MHNQKLDIPYDEIAAFCERHHIRKLSLFGSVLREDFREDSDIDVLVEFEAGHTPGWEYYTWGDELTPIIRHTVDLKTAQELSKYFRDRVLAEAVTLYDAAGTSDQELKQTPIAPTTAERDRVGILHLVEESKRAMTFVEGHSRADLDQDLVLNGAIQMTLERIGRFVGTLSSNTREQNYDLNCEYWEQLSQQLAEQYYNVDLDEVWRAVIQRLPPFVERLKKLLLDLQ
jgi:predicted nucleotidyltransferase/uncharacterized protein with HEPN domain